MAKFDLMAGNEVPLVPEQAVSTVRSPLQDLIGDTSLLSPQAGLYFHHDDLSFHISFVRVQSQHGVKHLFLFTESHGDRHQALLKDIRALPDRNLDLIIIHQDRQFTSPVYSMDHHRGRVTFRAGT